MVYILAGPRADESPISLKAIAPLARARGVPILVDAAAEILTIPNVHLQNGATLVGYSGGKCLRGPQAAGLLLGQKNLVRAAWVHSAPHHGFARSMKVGKEEAIGMLMAVEMWVKRDHDAEWKQWTACLDHIARRVSAIDGVTTSMVQPAGLSNRTPSLRVWWPRQRFGFSGEELARTLLDTEPRIALFPAGGAGDPSRDRRVDHAVHVVARRGEDRGGPAPCTAVRPIAARQRRRRSAAPVQDLTGQWDVRIEFAAGVSTHVFHVRQQGREIDGAHQGDFVSRNLSGTLDGDAVRIRSTYGEQHGDALSFSFSGQVAPGTGRDRGNARHGGVSERTMDGETAAALSTGADTVPIAIRLRGAAPGAGRSLCPGTAGQLLRPRQI